MKKIVYIVLFFFSTFVFSQNKGITYQAVIYLPDGQNIPGVDIVNSPMIHRPICLKFSFIDESSNIEYEEVVKTTTDEFGMVNLVIGTNTQTGGYASSFANIVWDISNKKLKVALDSYGNCASFEEISDNPLSSVPFAYAAVTAENISGVVNIANGGTGATSPVVARANLGLGNVNNTSDANKPISTATQTALNTKENAANKSVDVLVDGTSDEKFPSVKAVKTYVDTHLSSVSANIVDADTTTKGRIQLAGDLSGTAALPTVPGLALKENAANKSLNVTTDGTSDVKFPSVKAVKTYVDTAIAGATIADADATTKGKIQLAGDLSGTAALPTITANAITSSKVADNAITDAKIATVSGTKIIGNITGNAANVTGVIGLVNGGTGATTATAARTNLGLGSAATNNTSDFEVPLTINAPLVRTANAITIPAATATVNGYLNAADFNTFSTKIDSSEKAANNGVATLGNDGKIPSNQIPAISFQSANVVTSQAAMTAIAGAQVGSIAIRTDENKNYVLSALPASTLSNWLVLSTPVAVTTVNGNFGPNVSLTKSDLVLGNVDNTSDINKPISIDTQAALSLKANLASPTFTGTVSGITKAMVGLAQVDNTSDAAKPISTATQTALDLKANAADVASALALKENAANKSTTTTLGTSDQLFPTQNAVKTYADAKVVDGITDAVTTSAPTQNAVFDALALKANTTDVTTSLALKANATDVTTSLALKENVANKSTATDLGSTTPSDELYPSQKAVKAYVDIQSANAGVADSSITSAKIIDGTLVTDDFADGSVTPAKISGILPVAKGGTGASTVGGAKINLGLENVDNTTDAAKPISTATQTALNLKANASDVTTSLALKANASDVTTSLALKEDAANKSTATTLGTSDVLFPTQNAVKTYADAKVVDGITDAVTTSAPTQNAVFDALALKANASDVTTSLALKANATDVTTSLALKANLASPTFTGTVSGIDKTMVGLGNVEDTALSTWVGSNNLTTVGTITTGSWSGTVIGSNKGGAGTINGLLKADGAGVVSAAVAGTDYQAPLVAGTNFLVPNAAITGAAKTKITYDAKGLVTAGADATTADIAPSTDRNYVTDAQATVLSNTSGANTGDETDTTIKTKLGITTLSGSNTGDQTITLTGDVTGSGTGSFATTIANDAVTTAKIVNEAITYAKIQNVAADKVLGRISSGTGVVEEIATTGTGNVVRAESPTLVTPELGVATATSIEFSGANSGTAILAAPADAGSAIITLPSATGTLATLDGAETLKNKTLENPILTAPSIGEATASTVSFAGATSGSSTIAAPDNAGANNIILPAFSGTLATLDGVETLTNKTLTAPVLGEATATSINKVLITQPLNNATLTITDGKTLTAADDATVSGTNTGDETDTTIKTKLGITTLSGSNTGDQTITLTGDVTGTGTGSFATTIANDAVTTAKIVNEAITYAKIQNVAADKVLGRISSGSGVVEEIATTGTGNVVRATSPTLVSPVLGEATGTSLSVSGQLTSTVVTGTAPLVVTSTTPVTNLNIGGNAATATSATTATNIAGGAAGSIPYQTAAATTAMLAKGTDGKVLTLVSGLPSWETAPGISSVGSINATAVPEGAVISSGALKLAPADATNGGVVTNGTQTFGGTKTFNNDINIKTTSGSITAGAGNGKLQYNTAFGMSTLQVTTGNDNSGFGYYTLKSNAAGERNNAFGSGALSGNTTGNDNIAIGNGTLSEKTSYSRNIAIGTSAMRYVTGNDNIAIGNEAGVWLGNSGTAGTAVKNILIGTSAGSGFGTVGNNTTGSNSVMIGYDARPAANGETNEVVIAGYDGANKNVGLGSNTSLLGNTATMKSQIYGALTVVPNAATSGNGNSSTIAAQNGFTNSNGGALNLTAGNGNGSGNGGDINLNPGAKGTTGTAGKVYVNGGDMVVNGNTIGAGKYANVGNILFGTGALGSNTLGTNNIAIGQNALQNFNPASGTNSYNIAIGASALSGTSNTSQSNIAIGPNTMDKANLSGQQNIAIGQNAMSGLKDGNFNNAFGVTAMQSSGTSITGTENNAFGYAALKSITDGGSNSAYGSRALFSNTTGSENVAVGSFALHSNLVARNNTAIGSSALKGLNSTSNMTNEGSLNIALGYNAGRYFGSAGASDNTLGKGSLFLGYDTRPLNHNDTNEVVISGFSGTVGNPGTVGKGSNTTTIGNSATTDTYIYGNLNLTNQIKITGGTPGLGKVLTSDANGLASWSTPSSGGVSALAYAATPTNANGGSISGSTLTLAPADATNPGLVSTAAQTFAGAKSFNTDMKVSSLTVGKGAFSVQSSTAFGVNALSSVNSDLAKYNTAIGYYALKGTTTGHSNTAIGYNTLMSNTVGIHNIAIGLNSLNALASTSWNDVSYNTSVGSSALGVLATGTNNTALGTFAGEYLTSGGDNVMLGYQAASGPSSSSLVSLNQSIMIGANAKPAATGETNEIVIGYNSTGLGSNSTLIGNSSTTSSKIFGALNLPNTTVSSSSTTGALTVGGGAGIAGALNVGGSTSIAGTLKIAGGTPGLGKVLTSDAAGLATWATPSSGGVSNFVYDGATTFAAGGSIGSGTLTIGAAKVGTPGFVSAATQTFGGFKTFSPTITAASGSAVGTAFTPSLTAAANNDALIGVDINPYFSNGSYTGLSNYSLRVIGTANFTTDLMSNGTYFGSGKSAGNVAIGSGVLMYNTSGNENIGIGTSALRHWNQTGGGNNIAIGGYALGGASNAGLYNIAIGQYALGNNTGSSTTGSYNTAIGIQALQSNTTGKYNTVMGYQAMSVGTNTNSENSAFGMYSLKNTTGGNNSGFGSRSLNDNTSGSDNSAFGSYSLFSNTAAKRNTAMGAYALRYINGTSGDLGAYNIGLGYQSGTYVGASGTSVNNTTGKGSLFIGYDTRALNDGDTNEVVISGFAGTAGNAGTVGLGSNSTVIGNTSTTKSQIYGALTVVPNAASSGDGNASSIAAQNGFTNSNGGALNLTAGNGNGSGNGGDINLTPGAKGNTGTAGKVVVNSKVIIADGTQAVNRVLVSDANGLASWANPLPSGQYGDLANSSNEQSLTLSGDGNTTDKYLNSSITLPPGKWDVYCNLLTSSVGPNTSGNWWVRLGLSTSDSSFICVKSTVNNPTDFPINTLLSGKVSAVGYDVIQGHIIINNTSSSAKTYYLWTGQCNLSGSNGSCTLEKISSSSFGENLLMALPMY